MSQSQPNSTAASGIRPRILTGDTPTGKLHLGHYVGSVENRLAMQDEYDCYFLIANKHAFTTRADKPDDIRQSVIDIATDWLAVGIDPNQSRRCSSSREVPAIDELTFFFAMLIPFNRVMRNPTLKDEIQDKDLGDKYPFGFPMYAVGQCADILAFRPQLVPVGEDQLPHLELTREVARKFDQLYCGVNPQTEDKDYVQGRRAVPGHRAEARPREAARRHRARRAPRRAAAEDEQVAEQRDLPVRRRRRRAEEGDGDVHRPEAPHAATSPARPTRRRTRSGRSTRRSTPTRRGSTSTATLYAERQGRRRRRSSGS